MIWQFEAVPLQSEEAVRKLIAERGLPKNFTGTIEYHGIKIVVRRPKSFTREQNTQIQDLDQVWVYGGANGSIVEKPCVGVGK